VDLEAGAKGPPTWNVLAFDDAPVTVIVVAAVVDVTTFGLDIQLCTAMDRGALVTLELWVRADGTLSIPWASSTVIHDYSDHLEDTADGIGELYDVVDTTFLKKDAIIACEFQLMGGLWEYTPGVRCGSDLTSPVLTRVLLLYHGSMSAQEEQ